MALLRAAAPTPTVGVDVDANALDQMFEDVHHPQLNGSCGIVEENCRIGPDLVVSVIADSGRGPPVVVDQLLLAPISPVGIETHPVLEFLSGGLEVYRVQQILLGDAPQITGVAGEPDAADYWTDDRSHCHANVEQVILLDVDE